jgi:hypothetical protein
MVGMAGMIEMGLAMEGPMWIWKEQIQMQTRTARLKKST